MIIVFLSGETELELLLGAEAISRKRNSMDYLRVKNYCFRGYLFGGGAPRRKRDFSISDL